jgi:hypothetical protein
MTQRKRRTALEPLTPGQPVPLDDLPILEPEIEKVLLEKNGIVPWMACLSKGRASFFLPNGERTRISEVYRLCYERASNKSIISDFVGHFPLTALESPWLQELVKQKSRVLPNEDGDELLNALGNGFKRAARPTRINRQISQGRLEAARCARRLLQQQFDDLAENLDLGRATAEFIHEEVSDEVARRIAEDPRLKPLRGSLVEMLKKSQHYEASALIVGEQFHVRIRELQTNPLRRRTAKS